MRTTRTTFALVALVAAAGLLAGACSSDGDGGSSEGASATTAADGAGSTTTTVAGPSPSAGCEVTPAAAPGTTDEIITVDGNEGRYQLIVPEGYDGTEPLPLVFGLHALTVSYTFVPAGAGFAEIAEDYDFIGVSPSNLVDNGTFFWMAAPVPDNPDVVFMEALLDELESELCIDTTKVFSTGQSNGAQMSSVLACQVSDRITAVAPIAGVEFTAEEGVCDDRPVPVMAFHGDADPIVTYEGGGLNAATIANMHYWKGDIPADVPEHEGVDVAMDNWAAHNGCEPGRVEERVSPEVLRFTWEGCEAETVLYVVEGGGHTWPGRPTPGFEEQFGPTTLDIEATPLMFEFFLGPPDEA
ncbi:MAG: hypothetical protein JNK12_00295 [Acidimicrobiales bacterium]|nr:hypothetical protein [Acidimicrobiales bacterium]